MSNDLPFDEQVAFCIAVEGLVITAALMVGRIICAQKQARIERDERRKNSERQPTP